MTDKVCPKLILKSFLKVKELESMRCNNAFLKLKALQTQFVISLVNSKVPTLTLFFLDCKQNRQLSIHDGWGS